MMSYIVNYSLCIYWCARPESREEVAEKLANYLQDLVLLDDSFSSWYPPVNKKPKKNPPKILLDKASIAPILTTNVTDFEKTPMPDLGFGFFVWAGLNPKFRANISAKCGLYTKLIPNSVVTTFSGPEFPSLILMKTIFDLMSEIFSPEAGAVRIYERFISEDGEVEYKDRIMNAFGRISEDGKFVMQ